MRRRSYIDLPKRLPGTKRSLRSRARLLPILVAVPLVVVLWLTIGLPVLAVLSRADSGTRSARQVFFGGHSYKTHRTPTPTEAATELTTVGQTSVFPQVGDVWELTTSLPHHATKHASRPPDVELIEHPLPIGSATAVGAGET